ncbi:MAG TPA: DUF4126 family protein [Thermoanaerobaculia bacterium]
MTFLIGIVAGLRAITAPAVVCWAARLGWLNLAGTPLAWMGSAVAVGIFTLFAIAEYAYDMRPTSGSRKDPPSFVARVLMGALCGAAVGANGSALPAGLLLGAIGAVAGTIGGFELRARLARMLGRDLPAALIEDVLGVVLAILAVRLT